jgi:WD40 repeat protein
VRVWNAASMVAVGEPLLGHTGLVRSVAFSADTTRIASGGADGTVRIWDVVNGVAVSDPLRGHERSVTSVAITRDGSQIASGGSDGTVRIWGRGKRRGGG